MITTLQGEIIVELVRKHGKMLRGESFKTLRHINALDQFAADMREQFHGKRKMPSWPETAPLSPDCTRTRELSRAPTGPPSCATAPTRPTGAEECWDCPRMTGPRKYASAKPPGANPNPPGA